MERTKMFLNCAFRDLQLVSLRLQEAVNYSGGEIDFTDEGVAQAMVGIDWQLKKALDIFAKIKQRQVEAQNNTGVEF